LLRVTTSTGKLDVRAGAVKQRRWPTIPFLGQTRIDQGIITTQAKPIAIYLLWFLFILAVRD